MTRPDPSILIVAEPARRRRCQAILADERIPSRVASLALAPRVLQRYRPRVLVLDSAPSAQRVLRLLPRLRQLSPATGVVLISRRRPSTRLLMSAVRRGACGHLAAPDLSRDLPKAVRMVAARQAWLPRRLSAAIVADLLARCDEPKRS